MAEKLLVLTLIMSPQEKVWSWCRTWQQNVLQSHHTSQREEWVSRNVNACLKLWDMFFLSFFFNVLLKNFPIRSVSLALIAGTWKSSLIRFSTWQWHVCFLSDFILFILWEASKAVVVLFNGYPELPYIYIGWKHLGSNLFSFTGQCS